VIYKETVVPTLIRETKPLYQKVVEGTTYSQDRQVLPPVNLNTSPNNADLNKATFENAPIIQPTRTFVDLPHQFVERPAAVHEEIRREQVEEIQPVINVEKFKTEVIQKTQPLLDKEVRAVQVEERTLAREMLPEVIMRNTSVPMAREVSTVQYQNPSNIVIEKPAIVNETERRQIIEEIQPVIYKETVVPTLIRETKPVYQRVVEGTTYSHQTLPPMPLSQSHFNYSNQPNVQPLPIAQAPLPLPRSAPPSNLIEKDVIVTHTTASNVPFQANDNIRGSNTLKSNAPSSTVNQPMVKEKQTVTTTTTTTNVPLNAAQRNVKNL